ncbi:hypothetical protein BpHYR1_052299 [Brachionus plicatilis]|uniref:Uncharacterized protein n=1 Tax=Brachionus plicatilis TaxID=10195 RepID=A0A3M7QUP2_BRAPC|nr:hypothetical protein BpHYR1_052299 [Brachionus plicatilis]
MKIESDLYKIETPLIENKRTKSDRIQSHDLYILKNKLRQTSIHFNFLLITFLHNFCLFLRQRGIRLISKIYFVGLSLTVEVHGSEYSLFHQATVYDVEIFFDATDALSFDASLAFF